MSDSVQPHRWQPTRLRHPWDSLGKNTGVGCHCLLPSEAEWLAYPGTSDGELFKERYEMATHSSILAWRIPWAEEPGSLYSPWDHEESDTTEVT